MVNVMRIIQLFCLMVLICMLISCTSNGQTGKTASDQSEKTTPEQSEKLSNESEENQVLDVIDLSGKEIPRVGAPLDQVRSICGQPESSAPHEKLENALIVRQNEYLTYMIMTDNNMVVEVTLGPDPDGKMKGKSPFLYQIALGSAFKEAHMFLILNGFKHGKELNDKGSGDDTEYRRRYINEKMDVILWLTTKGEFGDVINIRARNRRLLEQQI